MAHNTLTYTYSDIDLDFTVHPVSKDVLKKYDDESVKRSVRNLVTTMPVSYTHLTLPTNREV